MNKGGPEDELTHLYHNPILHRPTKGGDEMPPICNWSEDEDGNWHTGCGEMYIILEGTPSENRMNFCLYCGKPLRQILYKNGSEDGLGT